MRAGQLVVMMDYLTVDLLVDLMAPKMVGWTVQLKALLMVVVKASSMVVLKDDERVDKWAMMWVVMMASKMGLKAVEMKVEK
jgi:hypothetical protein